MRNYFERKQLGDIDKILSKNTRNSIDLFPSLPYNKSNANIGNNTTPFRLNEGSTSNQLTGKGLEIKDRVQTAFLNLYPESKNKELFKDIDVGTIEKNIPTAQSVVQKNLSSSSINRSTFKKLPYITDGLTMFYAAAESGNHNAANAARKLAYTEVSQPISAEEDLPKREESTAKKEESKYNGWDAASDILAIASLIPGVDTIADLASIPVDLIRGDYISAGLSALGAIPVVGEIADTAKLAKTADKIIDAVKGVDNAIDATKAIDNATDVAKAVDMADDTSTVINTVKYPGNDPGKSPGKGFEWRGKSTPNEGKGNWYNSETGERWNSDLDHGDPIGPHWDYIDKNGNKFRVFPDGRIEKK